MENGSPVMLHKKVTLQQRKVGLQVTELVKTYSQESIIGPLSFEVAEGEFFSLLGPSGCGKSTSLRCIAGFERPDKGSITLFGERIERRLPHERGIGLVFQNHALFPHLTVRENVAFGLRLRKVRHHEIQTRVNTMLALVGLDGFGERMPGQISGGQQQRVALARSLVLEPPLLMLDEPLSSLDLKLRMQMREELRNLQRQLRQTTIFVTHDQTEALALSDRIAILSQGRIEQIDTPEGIYNKPASRFVADFIGSSNLIPAEVIEDRGNHLELRVGNGLHFSATSTRKPSRNKVTILVRPERIIIGTLDTAFPALNTFDGKVVDRSYLGEDIQLRIALKGIDSLLVSMKSSNGAENIMRGAAVRVHIEACHITVIED